jgi:branched-chain amino acid transport system substrate-binding protein
LEVVADTARGSTGAVDGATYLDGMRAAVKEVNDAGGANGRPVELHFVDDGGDPSRATTLVGTILDGKAAAILYVGPGTALVPLRQQFAQTQMPVVLLQGDLYTSRQLFPQAFQVGAPWEWQVKVIARYLVRDRHAKDVVLVGTGTEAPAAAAATRDALAYWGGHLNGSYLSPPVAGFNAPSEPASKADAVIAFGTPYEARAISSAVQFPSPHARITGGESLLAPVHGLNPPPPGSTACSTYTWAGWAEPIPRVGRFIKGFQAQFGRPPVGFEQEGYDAVRALALALDRDGGRGGTTLIHTLEGIKETSFSSFPIDLGPDDHVFLPRDELGLFAVAGPHERLDPWQSRTIPGELWRPIMRTFTYDGQRDNILDQDRPVFFPGWKKDQPGPYYWESRFGITSRPGDKLH